MARAVRVIRERIDPRLTAALFSNYRTPVDAILELIDNAIDSRLRGQPIDIDLSVRPGSVVLSVVGGAGMGPRELEREYLRWGGSRKAAGQHIGRYGQGGKAAIGHLGGRFEILAGLPGEPIAHAFTDEAYRDRSRLREYELLERPKPVDAALGYVRIEIGAVDRTIDLRRLRTRIAEVYRPLLGSREVVLRLNRAPVESLPWVLDEQHPVSVRAGGRLVKGWWGLLPDPAPPPVPDAGVRLYHVGRLVGAPEWFAHPGPAQHPALNRLVGEIELSHVPVTINKADFERGSDAWQEVETRLHRELAPVVRRLMRASEVSVSPSALRTAEQVRRILARALNLLESGKLFESEIGVGEAPDGQLTLDRPVPVEPAPTQDFPAGPEPPGPADEALSRPAPPLRGGSGMGRRSGVGEVVIRALDPRLRSAMVVEDGIRRVVINARYPLYEVRKGDLWYQLETALREVCVTIPEATVPEFERKVNELMLVSLTLAAQRRRRRPVPRHTPPALFGP